MNKEILQAMWDVVEDFKNMPKEEFLSKFKNVENVELGKIGLGSLNGYRNSRYMYNDEVMQWEQRGIIRFWGKYCVSPYEATSTKGSGYAVHYYGMILHTGSLKECMDFCEGESSNET